MSSENALFFVIITILVITIAIFIRWMADVFHHVPPAEVEVAARTL